jgi:hypothetical protein
MVKLDSGRLVLRHNLKMQFRIVADVVRHLKTLDFVSVSSDIGILTNSTAHEIARRGRRVLASA